MDILIPILKLYEALSVRIDDRKKSNADFINFFNNRNLRLILGLLTNF